MDINTIYEQTYKCLGIGWLISSFCNIGWNLRRIWNIPGIQAQFIFFHKFSWASRHSVEHNQQSSLLIMINRAHNEWRLKTVFNVLTWLTDPLPLWPQRGIFLGDEGLAGGRVPCSSIKTRHSINSWPIFLSFIKNNCRKLIILRCFHYVQVPDSWWCRHCCKLGTCENEWKKYVNVIVMVYWQTFWMGPLGLTSGWKCWLSACSPEIRQHYTTHHNTFTFTPSIRPSKA